MRKMKKIDIHKNLTKYAAQWKASKKNTPVDRLVIGVRNEAIEVIVLFLSDGSLLFGPDGLHNIDGLTIHLDGESHEGRIALDDAMAG